MYDPQTSQTNEIEVIFIFIRIVRSYIPTCIKYTRLDKNVVHVVYRFWWSCAQSITLESHGAHLDLSQHLVLDIPVGTEMELSTGIEPDDREQQYFVVCNISSKHSHDGLLSLHS